MFTGAKIQLFTGIFEQTICWIHGKIISNMDLPGGGNAYRLTSNLVGYIIPKRTKEAALWMSLRHI